MEGAAGISIGGKRGAHHGRAGGEEEGRERFIVAWGKTDERCL